MLMGFEEHWEAGWFTHTASQNTHTHTLERSLQALADAELREAPSLIYTLAHKRACLVIRPNGLQTVA